MYFDFTGGILSAEALFRENAQRQRGGFEERRGGGDAYIRPKYGTRFYGSEQQCQPDPGPFAAAMKVIDADAPLFAAFVEFSAGGVVRR